MLEEVRTNLQWAAQNGRIVIPSERVHAHDEAQAATLFNEADLAQRDQAEFRCEANEFGRFQVPMLPAIDSESV